MRVRISSVLAAATSVSLACCYASFLLWLILGSPFLPSSAIEAFVATTAALRMAIALSIKRIRRSHFFITFDILSLEILVLPVLAVASLVYPSLNDIVRQVLFAWPAAVIMVLPAYAIYKVTAFVRDGASLTTVLPSAVIVFVYLAILDSAAILPPVGSGLSGLAGTLASALVGSVALGAAPLQVAITGVLLYTTMVLYAATRGKEKDASLNPVLLLAVVGTLAALGWAVLASYAIGFAPLIFGVPGLALVVTLWVVSRAR